MSQIHDLRVAFLKQKGEEPKAFPISEYRPAKRAAEAEDRPAFNEWVKAFIEKQDNKAQANKKFYAYLDGMDPVHGRLNKKEEREFERDFLTKEQQEDLRMAREYNAELRDRMTLWYRAARDSM
jgi:hypothetical protein